MGGFFDVRDGMWMLHWGIVRHRSDISGEEGAGWDLGL